MVRECPNCKARYRFLFANPPTEEMVDLVCGNCNQLLSTRDYEPANTYYIEMLDERSGTLPCTEKVPNENNHGR